MQEPMRVLFVYAGDGLIFEDCISIVLFFSKTSELLSHALLATPLSPLHEKVQLSPIVRLIVGTCEIRALLFAIMPDLLPFETLVWFLYHM